MAQPAASGHRPLVREDAPTPGVRRLTLADPARRNALSSLMIEALQSAIERAGADDGVRVIVLAAEGPVFSSGHDLKELRALSAGRPGDGEASCREVRAEVRGVFDRCSQMMVSIVRCPKPVIAAVQGLATAAGCQLAASCDLVIAAESAAFATPGVDLGLFCSTPGVAVARSVGRRAALEMLLTGERVPAARAVELGLATRVVDDQRLEDEVLELARRLATRSPRALAMGKAAFNHQLGLPLEEAYALTAGVMADNLLTADADEGIDAFFEKRTPQW